MDGASAKTPAVPQPVGSDPAPQGPPTSGRSSVLPLTLMVLSLAVLYGITFWVVNPQVPRWIECQGSHSLLASALLILHHAVGTAFFVPWAVGLLILCQQIGGRQFGLMMSAILLLCALAGFEGFAALYLMAQRCG